VTKNNGFIHIAGQTVLTRTLMRKRRPDNIERGVDLGLVLKEILEWATKLVPSESGSILLDDPARKLDARKEGRLYFAACFGSTGRELAGTSLPDDQGIAGQTYQSGKPYISEDVSEDTTFAAHIDRKVGHQTRSIICAPIAINESIIGVIELINRKGRANYRQEELALLEIFAGYTAMLMENSLAAKEFEELSKRDNLTGLYNDRYFFARLEHETQRARLTGGDNSLIFFDLDRFKEINDNHGHLAGSTLLKELGGILKKLFKRSDAVLARYGGDEYVIILPGMSLEAAAELAEQVREAIAGHTFLKRRIRGGEKALRISGVITCSVGVASQRMNITSEGDPRDMAEALIRAADDAMYVAKGRGKNQTYVAQKLF
jgi:diguanylate cyclase (GGDEF)-like protein